MGLGGLVVLGIIAAILIPGLVRGFADFRNGSGWSRFGGLVPFAALALIGAIPLWWVAFRHREASFWWLPMIGVGFVVLLAFRQSAEKEWERQRREAAYRTDFPEVFGSAKPEAKTHDLKKGGWRD